MARSNHRSEKAAPSAHHRKRWVVAGCLLLAIATAPPAWALDGYHDRRGLYGGVSLNGLGGFGIAGENAGGIGASVQLGGGASDWITIGAIIDIAYFPSETVGKPFVLRPAAQFQMFFPPGLFIDASAGITWWNYTLGDNLAGRDDSDVGFSGQVGLGYEFWLGASNALAISADYDFTYLPDLDDPSHLLVFRLGFRWY